MQFVIAEPKMSDTIRYAHFANVIPQRKLICGFQRTF
jgi:hypothetical protein